MVVTVEQVEADPNHFLWRAQQGEIFEVTRDGVVFATLGPSSKMEEVMAREI